MLTPCVFAQSDNESYQRLAGFNYREIVRGDVKDTHLPMLIAFHYSSSSPEEIIKHYDSLGTDVRIILPRGNYPKRAGYSWFPADHYSKDTTTQIQTTSRTVDSVAVFLKALFKQYPVKPVVSGLSQGGDLSLLLAIRHPTLLKASLPMLGFLHREVYLNLTKPDFTVPIHLVHGEADKIIPIRYVQKQAEHLKRLSFKISLTTYPAVEHDVNSTMERDYSEILLTWLRGVR